MKIGDWIQGSPGVDKRTGLSIPGDVFEIRKDNRRKRDGGAGVIWTCTCPRGFDVIPCAHLKKIYDFAARGEIPPQLRLTYDGRRAATRCGCIKQAQAIKAGMVEKPLREKPKRHRAAGHKKRKQHEREREHKAEIRAKQASKRSKNNARGKA